LSNAEWLVVVAAGILFFANLGHLPLFDPDEPVYAQVAREMLQRGTFAAWWSPHYAGALWFDKPPLTYWLMAASMSVFGTSEFAARLPSAIAALAVVVMLVRMAPDFFPDAPSSGAWAGLIFATSIEAAVLSRSAITDMLLAAALLGAIWGLWRWLADHRRIASLLACGVATGIAVLIKGPVAIVLVGGSTLVYLLATKRIARLGDPWLWGAFALSLAVSLPWYLGMVHLHGHAFVQGFLTANNLTRYLQAEHPHTASPLFFIPVLILGFLPWSYIGAIALRDSVRAARNGSNSHLFALIWIVCVFVFFSASQSKLVTYIFPLFPMLAMLCGWWQETPQSNRLARPFAVSFGCLMAAAGVALIFLPAAAAPGVTRTAIAYILAGWLIAAAVQLLRVSFVNPHDLKACMGTASVAMIGLIVILASASLDGRDFAALSSRGLCQQVISKVPMDTTLYALSFKHPSLLFYSGRRVVYTDDRALMAREIGDGGHLLIITRPDTLANLRNEHPAARVSTVWSSRSVLVLAPVKMEGASADRSRQSGS
jgi:4-amino-4-deoxy-L-arabinose transferase-like glycosyltransferase